MLRHLIEDFERRTAEDYLTHLDEILRLHDFARDPEAGTPAQFAERSHKNIENRCLHQHVFDTRLAVKMVNHMGLQILAVDVFHPHDILLVLLKPETGTPRFRTNVSWPPTDFQPGAAPFNQTAHV
jgi:hypothetical protein